MSVTSCAFSLRASANLTSFKSHKTQTPSFPIFGLFHYHCSTTRWAYQSQTGNWATGRVKVMPGATGGNTEAKNQHPDPSRQAHRQALLARCPDAVTSAGRYLTSPSHSRAGTTVTTGWWSLSHTPEAQEAPKTESFSRISGSRRAWSSTLSRAGLKLNIQNAKIMASGPITSWQIDGETVETVTDFIVLSSKITADSDCSHEIKRCLLLGRKAMTNLDSILKSRDITMPTKVHLLKAMVFPVVKYRCESWIIKKAEDQRIDAFELWCWRRFLRVPWTARRSN